MYYRRKRLQCLLLIRTTTCVLLIGETHSTDISVNMTTQMQICFNCGDTENDSRLHLVNGEWFCISCLELFLRNAGNDPSNFPLKINDQVFMIDNYAWLSDSVCNATSRRLAELTAATSSKMVLVGMARFSRDIC